MFLAALLTLTPLAVTPTIGPDQETKTRLDKCLDQVAEDPVKGEATASQWRTEGGGYQARQCLAVAYANQQRWDSAATVFEDAAHDAEIAHDTHSADLWALAGNAWLAAGNPAKAATALDGAIASGTMEGIALGEAYLDRARVRVALDDLPAARSDLDRATTSAPDDPLAWLLSATLARRMNDLPRAAKDIREALRRSPDDASVHLESGNIAARSGDETAARASWARVIELAPGSSQSAAARKALEQFGAEK